MSQERDPRCKAPAKLVPPFPLPHVSRRALARVKDWLPPPQTCHYCSGPVVLAANSEVYGGRSFGDWPYVYLCRFCSAYVGLHPDTDLPLGFVADDVTREARKEAKRAFQRMTIMLFSHYKRDARERAYDWLSFAMGIPRHETHFGWFDFERCEKAREVCGDAMADGVAHCWDKIKHLTVRR